MIENYKKEHKDSYTLGVFPTIELLQFKPKSVKKVYLSAKGGRNRGIAKIEELCNIYKIPYAVDTHQVNKMSPKENTLAIGIFNKFESPIKPGQNHIVLVNPQDMGNIGTIMRTMLGFGFSDIAIIRPAVDVFHPKAVRSSMGAVFQLNFSYFDSLEKYAQNFKNNLYLFTKNANTSVENQKFSEPFSLVFGNEADGLPKSALNLGTTVKLRQSEKVDSLNISVSAAIAMYESSK